MGSNPIGGNVQSLGSVIDIMRKFLFFVFFCALIFSPLLGISENAGVT